MRFKVIGIVALLAMFAIVLTGVALTDTTGRIFRIQQNATDRGVEDLEASEQEAASSAAIDAESFASHLPVVAIDTNGQEIPGRPLYENGERVYDEQGTAQDTLAADGSETIPVTLELFDNEGTEDQDRADDANRLGDDPMFTTQAEMRIRGHSSSIFDKPSYRLTFTLEDRVTANPQDVLGMGVEEDWVLHGPYLDKSLMRNYLAMNLFGQIMEYTPDVRFVELFIDDQYQGLYVLMETVKHDANRVDIQDADTNAVDTSFLVIRDWYDNMDASQLRDFITLTYKTNSTGTEIAYPTETAITERQREQIEDYLNAFEKAIYSYDYDTPDYGYWNYIDTDSFVDYALVNEIALNSDAGKFSTWLYKDLGEKIKIGPLWDFNNAFDNDFEQSTLGSGFIMLDKPIFSMLFRDEAFTEKVIDRYRELREGLLSDENVLAYIDEVADYIAPAAERNYEVWGYTLDSEALASMDASQRLEPLERNPESWEEAVDDLKSAIATRLAWLDDNIETLRQYSHESAVKEYNH